MTEGVVTFLGIFAVAALWFIATELHKIRLLLEEIAHGQGPEKEPRL